MFYFSVIRFSEAQDIHFSQFQKSPLNLNPSYSGYFDGDYRFGANHRNQWRSVTKPYKTFSGYFDLNTVPSGSEKTRIGTGLVINNDKAGDSEFGITQAAVSAALVQSLGSDSTHFVSGGLQVGFAQYGLNYSNLTFDNQFNGDVFDPAILPDDVLSNDKLTFFDFAAGFNYLYKSSERFHIGIGIGMQHLFQPALSFFDDNNSKLNRKLSADLRSSLGITENFFLQPSFLYSTQKKFSETVFGSDVKLLMNRKPGKVVNLYAGLFLRTGDAIIPRIGLDLNELNIGISYDVNISDLKRASNKRGGYEFALTYIIKKVKPIGIFPPCPVY